MSHMIGADENVLDKDLCEKPELLGKECSGCLRALRYGWFRRDSSSRDGRSDFCASCEATPKLSIAEHTLRVKEQNQLGVKSQQWEDQAAFKNDEARVGRTMPHSDLITKLQRLIPDLYVTAGNIIGDLAFYQVAGSPQKKWGDNSFRYLFYCPTGVLPEFSQYEFDARDIPVREKKRGWRTVLLRLIKSGLLTEEVCNKEFGFARGEAAYIWYREIWRHRNRSEVPEQNTSL